MIELKPCPFCGSDAEIFTISYGYEEHRLKQHYRIRCPQCGISHETAFRVDVVYSIENGAVVYDSELINAIEKWNRRANEQTN